jgi:hypothetical protein
MNDKNIKELTDEELVEAFEDISEEINEMINLTIMGLEYEAAHEEFLLNPDHGLSEQKLMYITAGDDAVDPSHAALDGVIETAVEWQKSGLWPPNKLGCRCSMADVPEDTKGKTLKEAEKEYGKKIEPEEGYALSPVQMINAGYNKPNRLPIPEVNLDNKTEYETVYFLYEK